MWFSVLEVLKILLEGKAANCGADVCVDLALFSFSNLALTLRFGSLKKIFYAWEQREVEKGVEG
jgi:hypothetical protein